MGSVQWNEPSGECGMREGWQLWREVGAGGTGEGAVIRIYLRIKDLLYIDDPDLSVATRVPEDVIEAYNQLLLPYARSLRFLSRYRFVNFVVKGKDVLGHVDGSCCCHGFRAMERAIGGMWNAGGLAVVERGWCGRNG
ncbi:hypothetical protein NDU88_002793 [Pleurodeles waltl]|uniref:Uncharacterized protein n=1 Tax=Pleurodeles waltl TaxID=8319 RepID=A0AAV7NJM0_PLEWA|nr:hypothetical protein NDU88_002793 [Pleurodeles waltl]